jgi:protein-arginine kinase activator protein McsA
MICERCGSKRAVTIVFEMLPTGIGELYLCEDCLFALSKKVRIPPLQYLTAWIEEHFTPEEQHKILATSCPACGVAFGTFLARKLKGCAHCYYFFFPLIVALAESFEVNTTCAPSSSPTARIERAKPHAADQTKVSAAVLESDLEIAFLKERLEAYIRDEKYEQAKKTQDRIRCLEQRKPTPPQAA